MENRIIIVLLWKLNENEEKADFRLGAGILLWNDSKLWIIKRFRFRFVFELYNFRVNGIATAHLYISFNIVHPPNWMKLYTCNEVTKFWANTGISTKYYMCSPSTRTFSSAVIYVLFIAIIEWMRNTIVRHFIFILFEHNSISMLSALIYVLTYLNFHYILNWFSCMFCLERIFG